MSFINITYSTLEDAWGENFDTSKKAKKSKKTRATDPLCALYSKRYDKIEHPYDKRPVQRSPPPIAKEKYRKYYGYSDRPRRYKATIPPPPCGYRTEEEDEPTVISPPPPSRPMRSAAQSSRTVPRVRPKPTVPVVPKEDIDDYLSESEEEDDDDVVEDEDLARVYEEDVYEPGVFEENVYSTPRTKCTSKRERLYLDAGIFTISGVLMIFIMEQFIQIGMNLRSSKIYSA